MNDILKKKVFIFLFVLVIGIISIVNYKLQNESALESSSELVAYEEKQLQEMKNNIIVGGRDTDTVEESNAHEGDIIETAADTSDDDYFAESKAVVNMDRNKIISMLTEIIENREVDSQSKDKAVEQKLQIIEYMNQERIVENLLKNKGYKDVFILITDNSVNVSVKMDVLNKSDIAKIVDIVVRETGRSFEDIIIQNKH
ncbi:MAG: SpoIIIAH-like family protein [Clostridiales bacterium]|nr:SpoIIIAH-like family protein [Clostridiales bacterium]